MQRYNNDIKSNVLYIAEQARAGNMQPMNGLAQEVYDLLDTLQSDLDMICEFRSPESRINKNEIDIHDLNDKFQQLGSFARTLAENHNKLADEVDKLKKIFSFLMENKKAKTEDLDAVLEEK